MRGVLRGLVSTTSRMTVVDLEAGREHLSRGTARYVETLLLIAEPMPVVVPMLMLVPVLLLVVMVMG